MLLLGAATLCPRVPTQGSAEPRVVEPIRLMTFNVRYGTARDGRHSWSHRRALVLETIAEERPHVLGVQEALAFQVEALEQALPGHRRLGVGRLGGSGGEFCAVFVDRDRFEVEDSGTFWLSPTPEQVASRGWDAALPRICTWADLRDQVEGWRLRVMNTHFDHRGREARERSAEVMLARRGDRPTVMLGDLNAGERSAPLRTLRSGGMADTLRLRWPDAVDVATFNGFKGPSSGAKIDYVMVDDRFIVHEARTVRRADGALPSDHDPVVAEVVIDDTVARPLMPVLDGPMWYLTSRPDLGDLGRPGQQSVDHAIFRDDRQTWRLWSCVRGTAVGRVLYEWTSPSLLRAQWRPEGIAMRADERYGESIEDWHGQEWIQAPHVVRHGGQHWMLYGGHRSESGVCQICLASSPDGAEFSRRQNAAGHSRVFLGPGEARDPMTIRVGARWYCYYAGHDPERREPCKIYCRQSTDLVTWSDPVAVCYGGTPGSGKWSAECPFVVRRDGAFYLFRTTNYPGARTWVYRSRDPLDFGRDSDEKLIGTIAVAAPEVVSDGGRDYISTVHDLAKGIQLGRLAWTEARAAPTSVAFLEGSRSLWDFEDGTLGDWVAEGGAFAAQPFEAESRYVRGQYVGQQGRWYIGTYEGGQGDQPQGVLRSPSFELGRGDLSFLIAGGRDAERLTVALHRATDHAALRQATGLNSNAMRRVAWDVSAWAGELAYVVITDASSGRWGHVNADDFRFSPRPER